MSAREGAGCDAVGPGFTTVRPEPNLKPETTETVHGTAKFRTSEGPDGAGRGWREELGLAERPRL